MRALLQHTVMRGPLSFFLRYCCLTRGVCNTDPVHQSVRLLVHAIYVLEGLVSDLLALEIALSLLPDSRSVPVQGQRREGRRSVAPTDCHQDAPSGTADLVVLEVVVVDVDDLSAVQAFPRGLFRGDDREAGGSARAEFLFVVPPQGAVPHNAPVGEYELAEGVDVESEAFYLALVSLVHFLVVFFLAFRHVFPSIVVVVVGTNIHAICGLLFRDFVFSDLRDKFLVLRTKVIKRVELVPESLFVPKLCVLFVDHVLLATLPCRKDLVAVKTIMPELDFFVAVSQEPLDVYEELFIGNKEAEFLLHVVKVFFQALGFVVVEQTLQGIDFRVFLALGQRSGNPRPRCFLFLGLVFGFHLGIRRRIRRSAGLLLGRRQFLCFLVLFLLILFAVDVFDVGRPVFLFLFLAHGQGGFQPHLEFSFFHQWQAGLAAFQVVLVPVTLVVIGDLAPRQEDLSRSGGGC
mmetsp:Transcript_24621/g.52475  ORF Transcript_24621/g.52475 Transcript_24621/m.52475 type:complete len:461 (+) Transcript_24621:115-1497(+)